MTISNVYVLALIVSAPSLSFQQTNGIYEGEPCTDSHGQAGVCKPFNHCNTKLPLNYGNFPSICSFAAGPNNPIICCLPGKRRPQQSYKIARQKCEEYGKYVIVSEKDPSLGRHAVMTKRDHCAMQAKSLIAGGQEASPKEFPHMALLGYGDGEDTIKWNCGGSLISESFVLTAAHCSEYSEGVPASWVKLGELDLSTDYDLADPVDHKVEQIFIHPEYKKSTKYNDIALIKLENDVAFNGFIRPICLDTDPESDDDYLIASGWGHTEFGGSPSSELMKVKLHSVSSTECNYNYSNPPMSSLNLPDGILYDKMICAGDVGFKDACQGDSGGPLQAVLTDPYCMYSLVGITCFGRSCGIGYPGVYTRVAYYVPWIVEVVWPASKG